MNLDQLTSPHPAPARRRGIASWVWAVIGGAAVLVILGGAAAVWLLLRDDGTSPSSPAASTVTVSGSLTLDLGSGNFTWVGDGDTSCSGRRGYEDVRSGAQITITNPDGKVLALGRLGYGRARGTEDGYADDCYFTFEVKDVPAGHGIYGVEISHRGRIQVKEAELQQVAMSLG